MTTIQSNFPTALEVGAEELRQRVLTAEATLAAAQAAYLEAERAAARARTEQGRPAVATLRELHERFEDKAYDLAVDAGECPRGRWGSTLSPTETEVVDDGLRLTWDINGDYAPHCYLATWEALLAEPIVEEGDAS